MAHTRVDILRFSIAFALRGTKANGRKLALTEEERYESRTIASVTCARTGSGES